MNIFRKTLAILLSLTLVLGAIPFSTYAAESTDVATAAEVADKPADGTTTSEPFPKGTADSNSFRIPSLVTLSDGTIVAAADARWNTTYDGGGLDTIVSRSADNGANWNYTFANYLGDNGNEYNGSSSTCFIDPAMAVTSNDTIYMLVDLYPYGIALNGEKDATPATAKGFDDSGRLLLSGDNHSSYGYYLEDGKIYSTAGVEQTGYTVDSHFNITGTDGTDSNLFFADSPFKVVRTGYLYLTTSTNKGETWSEPTLLNLKTTSEQVCLVGPGRGLVTSSGMIVFPVYSYNGSQETQKMSFIYSTDNGTSWTRSANFTGASWSSESAVVELNDGTLRFFYRNGTTNLCYVDYNVSTSTWGSVVNTGLDTNSNCQISAIKYSKTTDGKQVILVSCPTGPNEAGSDQSGASYRLNGKIFVGLVNTDNTISWQTDETISVASKNSTNSFMYSCLTELVDGKIALLYEDNESAWGTGDSYYYQMSYATYDFPLTADTSDSDDSTTEDEEDDDVAATNTVDITLEVGETSQVYMDSTGNYESTATIEDTTVATMDVTGVDGVADTTVSTDKSTAIEDGATYILRVYNTNYALSSNAGSEAWGTNTLAFESNSLTANEEHMWTLEAVDGGYKIKNANGYLNLGTGNNTGYVAETGEVFTFTSTTTGWTICNQSGEYINALGGLTTYYSAGGWTGDGTRFDLYKVTAATEGSTEVTFTGVKPGTTTAVVGSTQYNITVNKKSVETFVPVGETVTFTDASTTPVVENTSVATASIVNGVLTIKGVAEGTTTVTTDYAVYTVTVRDGETVSVSVGGNITATMNVNLADGQTIKWTVSDSKYVSVASNYDSNGVVTNSSTIIGNAITDENSPVTVTGTIYNADGTVASVQKWLVTVTEGTTTNTTTKYIYINIVRIQNATVYYSINGGELVEITDDMLEGPYTDDNGTYYKLKVSMMDESYTGGFQISFFAKPDEGYALTDMSSTNSYEEYYCLSNGNADGVGSSAWPFVDGYDYDAFDALETKPGGNDTSVFNTGVGIRWGLAEGNFTVAQMKVMYANAIEKGCDGVLVFTKNNDGTTDGSTTNYGSNDLVTALQFVAQKLPEMEKSITSITRDNTEIDYTEGMEIGLGDKINYTITVYEPSPLTDYSVIEYTNIVLNDPLTGDSWKSDEGAPTASTSETGNYTFVNSATGEEVTMSATVYSYETALTLTASNFLNLVQDGKIINTATLKYDYASDYSIGSLSSNAEAVAEIMVEVPEYVIDFGLPVEVDLTNDPLVQGDIITKATAQYGSVEITEDRKFVYTPNKVLQGTDFVTLTFADEGDESAIVGYGVRIYPATTIYYEESFFGAGWTQTGTPVSRTQTSERINAEDTDGNVVSDKKYNYGYDPAYNATTDSDSYITASSIGTTANMTFAGTGIDVYANCLDGTGYVSVRIKSATSGKTYLVNTVAVNGDSSATAEQKTIKNAPIVSVRDLEHGTYNVIVTKVMDTKAVQIDGFRVYNTVADSTVFSEDLEDNPDFYELRDEVLAAVNIDDTTSEDYGTIDEMSSQVYNVLTDEDAAVIVEPAYSDTYTAQDLLDNGPKNELLLHKGATLIFKVTTKRDVQVGLKAPNGATSYQINSVATSDTTTVSGDIKTTVDQFYDMGVTPGSEKTYTFTITNIGDNNLSVTLLKICDDPNAAFNSLTEQDIEDALKTIIYGTEEPGTPDEPDTPVTPDEPETPVVPENPEEPELPDTPVVSPETEHECTMKEEIKPATMNKAGKIVVKCTECGKVESTKIIYKASNVKLGQSQFIYNGKVKNPKVIVKDSKGNVVNKKYYSVTKQTGRKNVGKYTYTVKFKGHYAGTKKLTLTVKPKATIAKKPVAAKKAFTVKWNKVSKQVTGYEIMYATNSKFTKGKKTVKVTNYKVTSKKITKLKAKQKYYVKVRTYKTVKVNGKKTNIYSNWSKYRTVTTKR